MVFTSQRAPICPSPYWFHGRTPSPTNPLFVHFATLGADRPLRTPAPPPPVPRTHYLSKYPLFLRNLSKSGQRGGTGVPRPRMLAQEPPCRVSGPWDVSEKIPLAIYLNGFGLAVSWTRLARVLSSRNWNLCLEGTPSTGRKSLVTLRHSLGVKRSKKRARVHQKGTRLNGKRDVPRSETISLRAPRFEILASQGPLFHGPEPRSHRTLGKKHPSGTL